MMMAPPQVVGVLLKKPGQHINPRVPPLDPQETKIRGELYVEDLNERRIVSIRMGWLWVENTQMRLPLRALNLRQASPGICQPHVLALGFTLSNSQADLLATFWADTEPIYWSWVRAIAAELVRQTPFRAQRCLNFLEILTICPRGPLPLPDSPTVTRRRSRSELRCWLGNASTLSINDARVHDTTAILETSRRRARSELRGWSSSNSSDEDLHLVEFRGLQASMLPKVETTMDRRIWGCSESSEGSDDSLPWGGAACRSSVDSIDSAPSIMPEPADTREQRIQRYKEARRRENEARSRRVLEEDAKRRKARREENNNNSQNNNETTSIAEVNLTERRIGTRQDNSDTTKNGLDQVDTARNNRNNPAGTRNTETTTSIWTCQRTKNTTTNPETNGGVIGEPSMKTTTRTTTTTPTPTPTTTTTATTTDPFVRAAETVDAIHRRLPPLKVSKDTTQAIVRFKDNKGHDREDTRNNNNYDKLTNNNNRAASNNNNNNREITTRYKIDSPPSPGVVRTDSGERRSRARERRNVRDRCQVSLSQQTTNNTLKTTFLQERRERLSLASRIRVSNDELLRTSSNSRLMDKMASVTDKMASSLYAEKECRERAAVSLPRTTTTTAATMMTTRMMATASPYSVHDVNMTETCEDDVAKLLARCQRVDHYVPVREKLTLFESLSRLGGRLARSTEDLGRSSAKPNPRGKQRARSLHDLNRAVRSVPVREMCRFFEGDKNNEELSMTTVNSTLARLNETSSPSFGKICLKDPPVSILKNNHYSDPPPCVRTSSRRKHYQK